MPDPAKKRRIRHEKRSGQDKRQKKDNPQHTQKEKGGKAALKYAGILDSEKRGGTEV